MNEFYDPAKLTIGLKVGVELDPYVLNYPVGSSKNTWVADQGGRSFVLRFYEPNKGTPEDFLANARKYTGIKHPAITPNYPPFYSNLWVFASSAVCGGEKLYSYLGKYPDGAPLNVIISLLEGIAKALDQTHKNNLFHGHLDLNNIHVVNGIGIMIGFGSHNWLKKIDESDMDMRFAPPEYKKSKRVISADADRFSFMRLLIAALLGESKVTHAETLQHLPDTVTTINPKSWKTLKNWCRPAPRHRPKSLQDVVRLLRADLYQTKSTNNHNAQEENTLSDEHANKRKLAIIAGGTLLSLVLVTLLLWPTSEPLPTKPPVVTVKATPPVATFEALPQTLAEPLKAGGTAPKIEKLPPATFEMGDLQGFGDDNEKPSHTVNIPFGFYMSRYEVTFEQYDLFAESTNRPLPPDNGCGRGNRPVINVSWYDAKAYAAWLTEQTSEEYRLPTEIEWEYSIRAESNSSFWYGEEVKSGYSVCDGCGNQWDGVSTAPVGSQISNPFGLYDMHGNVAEWVEDCYHDNYRDAPSSNSAWLSNSCDNRVLRGGSWFDIPRVGRSSTRYRANPDLKASNWGFRVTRIIRNPPLVSQ